jgi:cytochrome c oxidase subunit 3
MSTMSQTQPMSRMSTGKVALFIILISESVFFATLLVAYAALRDQNNWPMDHSLGRLIIPLINTGILLLSAIPAGRAIINIRDQKQTALLRSMTVTLMLGLVFVAGQIYEFGHAGLHINDQAFGGVFFTLMGFHAIHVLAGEVFLVLNIMRARLGDFSSDHYGSIELGTWFWYYVTLVWLVLFAALYLI